MRKAMYLLLSATVIISLVGCSEDEKEKAKGKEEKVTAQEKGESSKGKFTEDEINNFNQYDWAELSESEKSAFVEQFLESQEDVGYDTSDIVSRTNSYFSTGETTLRAADVILKMTEVTLQQPQPLAENVGGEPFTKFDLDDIGDYTVYKEKEDTVIRFNVDEKIYQSVLNKKEKWTEKDRVVEVPDGWEHIYLYNDYIFGWVDEDLMYRNSEDSVNKIANVDGNNYYPNETTDGNLFIIYDNLQDQKIHLYTVDDKNDTVVNINEYLEEEIESPDGHEYAKNLSTANYNPSSKILYVINGANDLYGFNIETGEPIWDGADMKKTDLIERDGYEIKRNDITSSGQSAVYLENDEGEVVLLDDGMNIVESISIDVYLGDVDSVVSGNKITYWSMTEYRGESSLEKIEIITP